MAPLAQISWRLHFRHSDFSTMAHAQHSEHFHNDAHKPMPVSRLLKEARYQGNIETTFGIDYWTYLRCPASRRFDIAHLDSIVVAVKGICRGNGKHDARGAIGVFYHDDHRWNEGTEDADAFTSQRADLHAALAALNDVRRIRERNKRWPCPAPGPWRRLRRVVVKTNSMYLVEAMTEHIERWNANGFVDAKGGWVVNRDLFRKMDGLIDDLNAAGVTVQFWHVSKDENREATDLANEALDKRVPSSSSSSPPPSSSSSDSSW